MKISEDNNNLEDFTRSLNILRPTEKIIDKKKVNFIYKIHLRLVELDFFWLFIFDSYLTVGFQFQTYSFKIQDKFDSIILSNNI